MNLGTFILLLVLVQVRGEHSFQPRLNTCTLHTTNSSGMVSLLILLVEGLVCENTSSGVTLSQCGCVHGGAFFIIIIVLECKL